MDVHNLERLRAIRTFPSLVKYLRDELDWPVESDDFDDLTFDYEPEELGLEPKIAVKIKEIKQLRPFITDQPWGIFFINFEPKQLPVVVLRRVLRALVIKKRQSLSKADQKFWKLHDLLFVSSYGESEDRSITFAHFSDSDNSGLPTLKVIGWDYQDTPLHLDQCAKELEKLHYSEDISPDDWRKQWASAFSLEHREVITTSKALAERMAVLATKIRRRVNAVIKLESEKGPIRRLYKAFQETLIHDLSEDDFADMYAQTITYGLFSARCSREVDFIAENLSDMIPITNPFLKELLSTFLTIGGKKGKIDFDELGINDVVQMLRDANMEAIKNDFDDKNPEHDPVIHFYQDFLKQYDAQKRIQRGVFYTPKPVVSFIVRSVDEILRKDFGLQDGLADTTTWGEMVKQNKNIKIPDGVNENEPFVQILDPAVGTGTFLVEVIDIIHKTMTKKWEKEGQMQFDFPKLWNQYVPKHLLPRLYGYELMMAPYAIAHMKIGLKLFETGYHFGADERARIYLTNSLEPPQDFADTFEQMAPALAHEAKAVNKIKVEAPITVIIGNPPYSFRSTNKSNFIMRLIDDYKEGLNERKPQMNDDYVKFIRFGQFSLSNISTGVMGMITNNSYLYGLTHRIMRKKLKESFGIIHIIDLGGDTNFSQPGIEDENVFDIQQGVAISIYNKTSKVEPKVLYARLLGNRNVKSKILIRQNFKDLNPILLLNTDNSYFMPTQSTFQEEYEKFIPIIEIFPKYINGIVTSRDSFSIDLSKEVLEQRLRNFVSLSKIDLLKKYSELNLKDNTSINIVKAQKNLKQIPEELTSCIIQCNYRPFDTRFIIYDRNILHRTREEVMGHLKRPNLGIVFVRNIRGDSPKHFFIADSPVLKEMVSSKDNCYVAPLYLYQEKDTLHRNEIRHVNIGTSFIHAISENLKLEYIENSQHTSTKTFNPEDILYYVYAIFYSPEYRIRYAEFINKDFPRIPITVNKNLFVALSKLGSELVPLHLMESPKLDKPITKWIGQTPSNEVEKVIWSDDTVWINKSQTEGFKGVTESVWNFYIGGYQVCEKWLKDRKGRKLSKEDIEHYQKIVVAINETIRIMKEIDEVIAAHGGWPIK